MITKQAKNKAEFHDQSKDYKYIRRASSSLSTEYGIKEAPLFYQGYTHSLIYVSPTINQFRYFNIAYDDNMQEGSDKAKLAEKKCKEEHDMCSNLLQRESNEQNDGIHAINAITLVKWCGGLLFAMFSLYTTATILAPTIRPMITSIITIPDVLKEVGASLLERSNSVGFGK